MDTALKGVVTLCRWFIDQRAANNEAQQNLHDLRTGIEDILPVLEEINEDDPTLKSAAGVFETLWVCLEGAKNIYIKYRDGWSINKPWVMPGCIKTKADYHKGKVLEAVNTMQLALQVSQHQKMDKILQILDQVKHVQNVANHTKMVNQDRTSWEIDARDVDFPRKSTNGLPKTVLGQGSFGVVGLGYFTGSTKDGTVERIPVAIKMVGANLVSVMQADPSKLQAFKNEVKFMCSIDHPNICESFGAITWQEGDLLMWILMEKLDVNLHTAIKTGLLKHGRDAPKIFTDIVAGIVSAVAYLHTPTINGKPSYMVALVI
jgi:hypothetical protein